MATKNLKRRKNHTGTIHLCSDGYYRGKVEITDDNGQTVSKGFSGKSEKQVKDKINKFIKTYQQNPTKFVKSNDKTYLDQALIWWFLNKKKLTLKKGSAKRLATTITTNIIPYIGHYLISELTADIIQIELINVLYDENYSLSSIKKVKSALHDFFSYWNKKQYTQTGAHNINMIDLIDLPASNNFKIKDIKCMDDEQVKRFLKFLFERNSNNNEYKYEYCHLISLILNTGLRLGEACGIAIKDYDPENKTLLIHNNLLVTSEIKEDEDSLRRDKEYVMLQETTKTSSGYRQLPLNEAAIADLTALIRRAKEIDHNAKYIAISKNGEFIWPNNLVRTINLIYKNARLIEFSGAHVLRHTYATALFAQGIDIKTVSSLLGHANVQITSDTYVHFIETLKYKAKTDRYFMPYPKYLLQNSTKKDNTSEVYDMTFEEVVKKYKQCDNIRQTADEFGISFSKAKKILITMGAYSTDLSENIKLLRAKGFSDEEIMNMLKISKNVLNINSPYDKGEYKSDNPS